MHHSYVMAVDSSCAVLSSSSGAEPTSDCSTPSHVEHATPAVVRWGQPTTNASVLVASDDTGQNALVPWVHPQQRGTGRGWNSYPLCNRHAATAIGATSQPPCAGPCFHQYVVVVSRSPEAEADTREYEEQVYTTRCVAVRAPAACTARVLHVLRFCITELARL